VCLLLDVHSSPFVRKNHTQLCAERGDQVNNHYDTVQASDGYSAIAVAQKEQPDLIILDLGLPAEDGLAVLRRLKESDTLSQIPVIVMTGRAPQFNEQEALQAGATAFFQKPTDDSDLLDVVRVTLSNIQRGGQMQQ
jgi:CheY-like chemotaxis protein